MKTNLGEDRTFPSVRKTALWACNKFLQEIEHTSIRYYLQVYFSKGEKTDKWNGLFIEIAVIGILEAKYFVKIDMISLFMEEFPDRLFSRDKAPIFILRSVW